MMRSTVPKTVAVDGIAATTGGHVAERYGGLDALRIVAALAVVCIHVPANPRLQAWTVYCRFAVPAFTTMSVLLLTLSFGRKVGRQPIRLLVRRRFVRLYALFLFWNVVYLLARVFKKTFVASGDALRFSPGTVLLSSFAEHLWYLSFIALFSMSMAGAALVFWRLGKVGALAFASAIFLGGCLVWFALRDMPVDLEKWPSSYFAAMSIGTLPAGMAGLLLAWLWLYPAGEQGFASVCALSAAIGAVLLWLGREGPWAELLHNLAGVCLVFAALTLPLRGKTARLAIIAAATLPVYCVHVLIIEAFQAFARKLHVGNTVGLDVATLVMTLLGSGLFAWLLLGPWRKTWLAALHR